MIETTQLAVVAEPEQQSVRCLEGQVILVTGGSRGIGRAIVEAVSRQGATVCFTYAQSTAVAEELAQRLTAEGRLGEAGRRLEALKQKLEELNRRR